MARPARFERATAWFVARYSIQLSYGRVLLLTLHQQMAEREGFEPSMSFRPYALSRGAPSATRPSLPNNGAHITTVFQKIKKKLNKINTLANFIDVEYNALVEITQSSSCSGCPISF